MNRATPFTFGTRTRTKRRVILANAKKYSISAMCKALKIARSTLYYKENPRLVNTALENAVIVEFKGSRNNYGTRKLKKELSKKKIVASRRLIGKIMKKYDLESNYTLRRKKKGKYTVNNDETGNIVAREFNGRAKYEVVVSDLTYVEIGRTWHYLCVLLDLCGRKIIGSAVGHRKDAKLVETAIYSVQADLREIQIFHTDRGSEFKNAVVEQIMGAFWTYVNMMDTKTRRFTQVQQLGHISATIRTQKINN